MKRVETPQVGESSASCDENHEELVRVQIDSKWEKRATTLPSRKPTIAPQLGSIGTEALLSGVFNSDPTSVDTFFATASMSPIKKVDTLFEEQPTVFRGSGEEWCSAPSDNAIPSIGGTATPGAYSIQPGQPSRLARDSPIDITWLPGDEVEETPSQPQSASNAPPERIMVDATLVPEELSLPRATEIIPANLSTSVFRRRALSFVLLLSAVAVISIAVGSVVTRKNRDHINASKQRISFVQFRDSFLPRDSLQRAVADPYSPQGSALKWLQNDVNETKVVAWRMLQRYSLVVVYFALNGATWSNNTGWLSDKDECQWKVVAVITGEMHLIELSPKPCDEDGRFVNLWVMDNNVTGSLPHEIGFLTNLTILHLAFNMISGSIPTSVGCLLQLKSLILNGNSLTGKIPSEVGLITDMISLDLGVNQLTGQIPSEIGRLSHLSTLYLHANFLSGSIPTEVGLLANLADWNAQRNSIRGSIPTEVGFMTSLALIVLDQNQLTGSIPTHIGHLTGLMVFNVYYNNLSGGIPPQFCDIPSLLALYLTNNTIGGTIPPEL
jgi:Leucine rich repeat